MFEICCLICGIKKKILYKIIPEYFHYLSTKNLVMSCKCKIFGKCFCFFQCWFHWIVLPLIRDQLLIHSDTGNSVYLTNDTREAVVIVWVLDKQRFIMQSSFFLLF